MSTGEHFSSPKRTPQRQRPALTVSVSDGPSSTGRVTQLLENPTPRTRRVSKLPLAEACRITQRVQAWLAGHSGTFLHT